LQIEQRFSSTAAGGASAGRNEVSSFGSAATASRKLAVSSATGETKQGTGTMNAGTVYLLVTKYTVSGGSVTAATIYAFDQTAYANYLANSSTAAAADANLGTYATATLTASGTVSLTGGAFTYLQFSCYKNAGSGQIDDFRLGTSILDVVNVTAAPTITGLTNQTLPVGGSTTLTATVNGSPTPTLQWYLSTDGGTSSNAISGATSSTYSLNNVQYSQNGYKYYLWANNSSGTVVSNMTLTVTHTAPIITGLTNQTVYAGNNATMSATVGGVPPPTLQWYSSGSSLTDKTNSSLILTSVTVPQSGTYSLVASNEAGIVTNSMILTVVDAAVPPTITGLTNQTVLDGGSTTLAATVGGNPTPALLWYLSTDGGASSNIISGATISTYALNSVTYSQNGYKYYLMASNSAGVLVSNMTLTVQQVAPTISGPVNQTVIAGMNATLSATVNGSPAPTLQWQVNGAAITSATNSTLVLTNIQLSQNGYVYSLVATNPVGALTNSMTLTVNPVPSIFVKLSNGSGTPAPTAINPPTGQAYGGAAPVGGTNWIVVGHSAVAPAGLVAPTNYVVYSGLPLSDPAGNSVIANLTVAFNVYFGSTTRTAPSTANGNIALQPNGVMSDIWRDYEWGSGFFVFSVSNLPPSAPFGLYYYGGSQTANQGAGMQLDSNCTLGSNPTSGRTTNNALATLGDGVTTTYGSLWNYTGSATNLMPQGSTWNVLFGKTDASGRYTFTNVASTVSGVEGAWFNGFQLVPLSAPTQAGLTSQTVIAGNSTTLSATVVGLPVPVLQWYSNNVVIPGATTSSLPLNNVQYAQDGVVYSLVASNILGSVTNSMTLSVIVTPSISGLADTAASPGTTITLPATVSGAPAPSLQWLRAGLSLSDGATGNGSTISGSTSSTLTIANAATADSGYYSLVASNAAGMVTNTIYVTITSQQAPIITGPVNQTVVQGSNATFTVSISANPAATLQWLDNTGTPISGATGNTLALTNVQYSQNGYTYSLVASNSVGVATNSATLTVLVPVAITQQPTNVAVVIGTAATFSVAATGVPIPSYYQWYRNGSVIGGANTNSYTLSSPQGADNGATFSVVVSNSVNSVTSSAATLTVLSMMTGTFLPTNGAVNISPDQQLRITFSGGTPKLAYTGKKLYVYDAANNSLFTTIDTSQFQTYTVDGATVSNAFVRVNQGSYFYYMPIALYDSQAWITFTNHFSYGHTYYVTCDTGLFVDSTGSSFAGITGTNIWSFSTKAAGPATPTTSTGPTSITVGLDGAGDFATLQGASDWIPQNNTLHRTITIQPGTYHDNTCFLQGRSFVSVTGATTNRNDVQLICPSASYASPSTGNSATLNVGASDDDFRNITLDNKVYLTNTYANTLNNYSGAFAGRLLVLITTADRLTFDNVAIKGGQDTYYASGSGYFHNCEVWGTVDFIYGPAVLVFDQCNIVEIRNSGGPITAPNTPYAQPYGMNFLNCTFPQALVANGYPYDVGSANSTFQRAWGQDGMTAVINCAVGSQISAAGWSSFGYSGENTCRAREYGTTLIGGGSVNVPQVRWDGGAYWLNTFDPDYTNNPSLNPTNSLLAPPTGTNNRVVVTVNPSDYTVSAIFGNSYFTSLASWTQATIPIILQSPTNQLLNAGDTATFAVTASGLPAATYQWLKNGTNLVGQTAPILTIANAQISDVGDYSVVVSNSAGTVTSTTVSLLLTGVGPAAPALSASAGVNQVVLTWSATPTATSYNLKRSTVSGGFYVTITNTSANGYLDAGLVNGTTYYYVVTALNSQGESVNSSEANATPTCITPSVPSGVSAAAGNMQVILGWNAASFATSYNVKRATVSGGSYTTITNVVTTNYTDATAVNGTTYYYVVSAANSCAESGNSPELSATPAVAVAGAAIYQVNSGGSAVDSFAADAYYSGGTAFSSGTSINTNGVNNPAPMSVYQTERYGNSAYTFTNLTAGANYIVRLHFAELYWGTAGSRMFNVSINGTQVLTNFDIYAVAGAKNKAVVRDFTVVANGSGQIVIQYTSVVDSAKASGIEILSAQTAPTITSQPSDQSVVGGATATFTATAMGYPSPTYQWLKNGNLLSGQIASSLVISNANANNVGSYLVIVSNSVGMVASRSVDLTVANTAPTLAPVSNQSVNVGVTLNITNIATDPDVPAQTLTYSLLAGPAGSAVDSGSGNFTWRPTTAQANSSNPVSVVVTDNGTPNLSATNSFNVTVNTLTSPTAGSPNYDGSQFSVSVNGQVGPDYYLQANTNLSGGTWTTVATNTPTSSPFNLTDPNTGSQPMQFYRIFAGPPAP
jgi:pectin methylesterase-like acyl-CoA thioesterase